VPAAIDAPRTIRCFVALQPDAAARARLDRLAQDQQARFTRARRMRPANLHLTLAFIGALDEHRARQLAQRLQIEPGAEFVWSLDTLGAFAGARVMWAGGSEARLDVLACRVRQILDDQAVAFDRKPFVAHVTLLRNVPRGAADGGPQPIVPPIGWRVGPPVLLQSMRTAEGSRYEPVPVRAGNG